MSPAEPGTGSRLADLKDKVEKDPKSRLFVQLAEEYRRAGQAGEAIAVVRRGLEHHPTYVAAWIALGKYYVESGRDADAQPVFEKALSHDPGNVVAARLLGDVHHRRGQFVEAVKRYKLVRAIQPGDDELDARIEQIESLISGSSASDSMVAVQAPAVTPSPVLEAIAEVPVSAPEEPSSVAAPELPFEDDVSPFDESGSLSAQRPAADRPDLDSSDLWREVEPGDSPILASAPAVEAVAQEAESVSRADEDDFRTAFIPSAALLAEMSRTRDDSDRPEPPVAVSAPVIGSTEKSLPPAAVGGNLEDVPPAPHEPMTEEEVFPDAPVASLSAAVEDDRQAPVASAAPNATLTMADLYIRQGHLEKARAILIELRGVDPENALYVDRLAEIERQVASSKAAEPAFFSPPAVDGDPKRAADALRKWLSVIKRG